MNEPTADYRSPLPDRPTPEVPDFALIRMIGRGGFGQVWLATNRITGHLRAVKVIALRGSGATDPAGREIGSLTRLEECLRTHHPNLVEIQHVGKTAEHLFYVMEPADDDAGGPASGDADYRPATLQGRIEAGPLPADECLARARELLAGLAHLHAAGMVHRDVKPANCLMIGGRLKLADFGLVVEATPLVSRVGTRRYMPPDGRMDTRADVYAAGLVIYEMLTGLPVEDFPRLGPRATQIAEDPTLGRLNRLVLRACQPDPRERFRDAGEMLAALSASPRSRGRRRKQPRRRMAAWMGALVAVAVAAVFVTQGPWAAQARAGRRQFHHRAVRGHDPARRPTAGRRGGGRPNDAVYRRGTLGRGPSRGVPPRGPARLRRRGGRFRHGPRDHGPVRLAAIAGSSPAGRESPPAPGTRSSGGPVGTQRHHRLDLDSLHGKLMAAGRPLWGSPRGSGSSHGRLPRRKVGIDGAGPAPRTDKWCSELKECPRRGG